MQTERRWWWTTWIGEGNKALPRRLLPCSPALLGRRRRGGTAANGQCQNLLHVVVQLVGDTDCPPPLGSPAAVRPDVRSRAQQCSVPPRQLAAPTDETRRCTASGVTTCREAGTEAHARGAESRERVFRILLWRERKKKGSFHLFIFFLSISPPPRL